MSAGQILFQTPESQTLLPKCYAAHAVLEHDLHWDFLLEDGGIFNVAIPRCGWTALTQTVKSNLPEYEGDVGGPLSLYG